MKQYILVKRFHSYIDLTQTLELTNSFRKVYTTIASGGKILFISTKQAQSCSTTSERNKSIL